MSSTPKVPVHHYRKHSRISKTRIFLCSFVFLSLFVLSFLGVSYYNLQSSVKTVNVNSLLKKTSKKDRTPTDSYDGKPINILVMGSDSREGENSRFGDEGGMRSDTTLVVHVSADRKHAEVVSIPRDTLVNIPACHRADGTSTAPSYNQMFNSAFAYGGLDGNIASAAACTIATVEQLSGLTINEFVVVDFSGFMNVVNSLGGIEYCFDEPVNDPKSELYVDAGCQNLNGFQALGLARARYSIGDGSDLSRINRQQELLSALIKKVKSQNILTDIPTLYSFAKSSLSSLTTSEGIGSLSSMVGLAYSMRNLSPTDIQFVTMPVVSAPQDRNRLVPLESAANTLWEYLRQDKAIPADFSGVKPAEEQPQTENQDVQTPSADNTQSTTQN